MKLSKHVWACFVIGLAAVVAGCSSGQPGASPTSTAASSDQTAPSPTVEAPDLADLLSAPVPSLCEHEPGVLEDGVLPDLAREDGIVTLGESLIEAARSGKSEAAGYVAGSDASGNPFMAAVVACDLGGSAWPEQVVVWNADVEVIGVFEPMMYPSELELGDRQRVRGLEATEDGFLVRWIGQNANDAACCGQLSLEMPVVVGTELAPGELTTRRGEAQVRAVIEAAMAGSEAPDIEVPSNSYNMIENTLEVVESVDLDGITCEDTDYSPPTSDGYSATIACTVPAVATDGSEVAWIAYPQLKDWDQYIIGALAPSFLGVAPEENGGL